MKKNKLRVIILFLVVIEGVFLYLNYKSYNNKENNQVFNEVKIADNIKEAKQIAIKQQKEDFTWEDKGTSMSSWPDINTFEYYGSECTDAAEKAITPTTDVIQFNEQTQTATISTSKTIYCTLKFARKSKALELMQKTTTSNYLKTSYEGDELLRYVGEYTDVTYDADKDNPKAINNFICFGTENKDTCLADKNTYMYRIIGITTSNVNKNLGLVKDQLKIIKAAPPSDGKSIKWASAYSSTSNFDWDYETTNKTTGATARWYLNNDFLETITGTVGTHQWSDLISNTKWYKGDNTSSNSSNVELKALTSGSYKVGLMYASDYYNSWTYATNKNSWLHIAHGMSGSTSVDEWTMTRYGKNSKNHYCAWRVYTSGYLKSDYHVGNEYPVRPVFYLTRDISISGQGTESDPFIISDRIV